MSSCDYNYLKSLFVYTVWTNALYDEVCGVNYKLVGQAYSWYVYVMETIGAAAFFAIEMYMLVVEGVVALACAKFVF